MLKKGDLLNGRYEIIENIGTGGMSDVYKAKCRKLNRFVAIKILKRELGEDENLVRRFKVEAQAAAGLSHQNIVAVYDVGDEEEFHYIVMEYLEGKTLKQIIEEVGTLTETEIYHVATSVLAAISHSHHNHIIHRDIKPQNIFWTKNNKIKVMDFGIAHIVTDKTIEIGENLMGSVHYVSPEQVKGLKQNESSDIYSLGITMYEMAIGKVPFDGDNPVNIAVMHIEQQLPLICEQNPKISKNFETIIRKATEKKTINRYATASEMLSDLKAAYQHPERVIEHPANDMGNTMRIKKSEIKQIWTKDEYINFSGEKDPYDFLIRVSAFVSAFLVVAIVTYMIFSANIDTWVPKMYSVPDLQNVSIHELSLYSPKLNYQIEGYVYHDSILKDHIVDQDIKPKEAIREEDVIGLIVSKGVEEKAIPNVLNRNYSDAQILLEDQGFTVERVLENDDIAAIGTVFRQSPEANVTLAKGSIVTIYVSKGAEVILVTVPDLINTPKQDALIKLKEQGFIVNVTESYNEEIEKGKVAKLSIVPGSQVIKGSAIDVTVSLGKENRKSKEEFRINSPFGLGQEIGMVKVTLTQDNIETTLYDEEIRLEQFPLLLSAEGEGSAIITVYLDGIKQYTRQLVFTEE